MLPSRTHVELREGVVALVLGYLSLDLGHDEELEQIIGVHVCEGGTAVSQDIACPAYAALLLGLSFSSAAATS